MILQGPDGRIDGIVQEWSERGYGFIEFSDGRRAYVHNSHTGGVHLEQGQKVSAIPAEDEKNPGKWCARDVRQPLGTPHDAAASQSIIVAQATSTHGAQEGR